jgi:hypothetical protein
VFGLQNQLSILLKFGRDNCIAMMLNVPPPRIPAQQRLHDLLMASGKDGRLFEIRPVPDSEFGFVHGKGGIIEGAEVNGGPTSRTSFIGSANDSARAWT